MPDTTYVTGRYTICKIDGKDYVSLTDIGLDGAADSASGRTKKNAEGNVDCLTNITWSFNGSMTIVGANEASTYTARNEIRSLLGQTVDFEYFTCVDPEADTIVPVTGTDVTSGKCFISSYSEANQLDDNMTCTFACNIQGKPVNKPAT